MTGLNPGEPKWQLILLMVLGIGLGVMGIGLFVYLLNVSAP